MVVFAFDCFILLYIALFSATSSIYFIKIFVDLTFYAHICTKLVGLAWSLKKYIQALYGVCSTSEMIKTSSPKGCFNGVMLNT